MKAVFWRIVPRGYWRRQKDSKSGVYRIVAAAYKAYSLPSLLVRLWYYLRYRVGYSQISIRHGTIVARYDAMSPKNLWHLAIGSRTHENQYVTTVLEHFVRPGDTCLDIGASTGMYTISLALRVGGGGHVIAFERNKQPTTLCCGTLL